MLFVTSTALGQLPCVTQQIADTLELATCCHTSCHVMINNRVVCVGHDSEETASNRDRTLHTQRHHSPLRSVVSIPRFGHHLLSLQDLAMLCLLAVTRALSLASGFVAAPCHCDRCCDLSAIPSLHLQNTQRFVVGTLVFIVLWQFSPAFCSRWSNMYPTTAMRVISLHAWEMIQMTHSYVARLHRTYAK